jgi:CBS domain-containing protein
MPERLESNARDITMKVSEWVKLHPNQPVTVPPDSSIEQVTTDFLAHAALRDLYGASSERHIIGHIRHRRLAQLLLTEHLPVQSSRQIMERIFGGSAEELMENDFVTAHPNEELDNVFHRMLEYEVEDMPVVDSRQRIIGNINLTDILRELHRGNL